MEDRRKFPRYEVDFGVKLHINDSQEIVNGKVENVNLPIEGIMVRVKEDIPVGTRLNLKFIMPQGDNIDCWGTVLWSKYHKELSEAGIYVDEIKPSDKERIKMSLREL